MKNSFLTYEPLFFQYNKTRSNNMTTTHFHAGYEIYYLLSGKRRYFIEKEIYNLEPGDMILIPKMCSHRVWSEPDVQGNDYHERYLLSPLETDIPPLYLPLFDTHFYRIPSDMQEQMIHHFQSIQKNMVHEDAYTKTENRAIMIQILTILARLPHAASKHSALSKRELLIQNAATYIQEHCSDNLSLQNLAEEFSFNKEYFSSIFKKTTGFGFNEYLNQMRIEKAINLLINTDRKIYEISSACGFNDSNYFTGSFRKAMGYSPKEFRKKHRITLSDSGESA